MKCAVCKSPIENNELFCSECKQKEFFSNISRITSFESLIRRANKMVEEFDNYPLMPQGDYSFNFINKVLTYNPLFVLDDLKKAITDMLLEQTNYKYSEEELMPIVEITYGKKENFHKARILRTLMNGCNHDIRTFSFNDLDYIDLRPQETTLFYYGYSIFYIARDLKDYNSMLVARGALKFIPLLESAKCTLPMSNWGSKRAGKIFTLPEFEADQLLYAQILAMIEAEINNSSDSEAKEKLSQEKEKEKESNGGCYIATCVYGSYDCPEVWTLRRFRDYSLDTTWYGRMFIHTYYKISPVLVKRFGEKKLFKKAWRKVLDKMVERLCSKGIEMTPYQDKNYN